MLEKRSQDPSTFNVSAKNSLWPGDWYLYSQGEVKGPLTAEEAFSQKSGRSNEDVFVSRQGFTQWYPLRDLAELFQVTEAHSQKAASELERLKASQPPKVVGKNLTPNAVVAPVVTPPPSAPSAADRIIEQRLEQQIKSFQLRQSGVETITKPTQRIEQAKPKATAPINYDVCRDKLRLGALDNPYLVGFFRFVFTAGTYWCIWCARTVRELAWHTKEANEKVPPLWMSAIPGLHVFMAYRLALAIQKAELQNHYNMISPFVAALLSVIPPFGMAYMQNALNRHWRLHVRHAIKKKR